MNVNIEDNDKLEEFTTDTQSNLNKRKNCIDPIAIGSFLLELEQKPNTDDLFYFYDKNLVHKTYYDSNEVLVKDDNFSLQRNATLPIIYMHDCISSSRHQTYNKNVEDIEAVLRNNLNEKDYELAQEIRQYFLNKLTVKKMIEGQELTKFQKALSNYLLRHYSSFATHDMGVIHYLAMFYEADRELDRIVSQQNQKDHQTFFDKCLFSDGSGCIEGELVSLMPVKKSKGHYLRLFFRDLEYGCLFQINFDLHKENCHDFMIYYFRNISRKIRLRNPVSVRENSANGYHWTKIHNPKIYFPG